MKIHEVNCVCLQPLKDLNYFPLKQLLQIRNSCPVLKEILIPEYLLPYFEETYLKGLDRAWHSSISLLALQNGRLDRITAPLHRFGFDSDTDVLPTRFVKDHQNALAEKYIMPQSSGKLPVSAELWRHQTFKKFFGLLVELMAALWIEESGCKIENLSAWGGSHDVDLKDKDDRNWTAEIKSIGQDDDEFEDFVHSHAHVGDLYGAINFVLFRIGEALLQLKYSNKSKRVIIIINEIVWPNFELQLNNSWIDWQKPAFLNEAGPNWQNFVNQNKNFCTFEESIAVIPQVLDSLWFVRLNADLTLTLAQEIRLKFHDVIK